MEILLNGEKSEVVEGTSLAGLIENMKLEGPVAAMVNDHVIPRERLAATYLAPGDRVELLRMMGGG